MAALTEVELSGLMDRLVDGDRGAFTPLFEALYPRARAVALRRLDPHDAEDAAQRTMTAVFARSIEFSPGRPVLPWFYAIAANETHAIARRRRIEAGRVAPLAAAESAFADDDPEGALARMEVRACVREAIASLDPLSVAAIEGQLDEALAGPRAPALRKRISRAYARLRILLGGLSCWLG